MTPEQQADLEQYDKYLRGTVSSLMRLHREADPVLWAEFAKQRVDPVLTELAAADPKLALKNTTGLAGAQSLTVEEFLRLQALSRQLVALAASELSLIVKAVGVNAR